MYEFPDANVCNLGCKRLHSRLQVFASMWDSAIFGRVNNCKSARKCVPNMALSLVCFVSYVRKPCFIRRKPCFIRFQPPFLPFSAWLKCKSAGHRSILTDSGSTSGKQKVSRMTILRAHLSGGQKKNMVAKCLRHHASLGWAIRFRTRTKTTKMSCATITP